MNKHELLKRAKAVLSPDQKLRADAAAANAWANNEANNHGFPFLDDTDPCNDLLAEMSGALVKSSLVKPDDVPAFKKLIRLARSGEFDHSFFSLICEKLTCLCQKEAQCIIGSKIKVASDEIRRIERRTHAADLRFRPGSAPTPLKNALKVMVGIKPDMPKGKFARIHAF